MDSETFREITRHLALAAARLDFAKPKEVITKTSLKAQTAPLASVQHVETFASGQDLDLGRISKFISDSSVTLIECSGSDKPIKIRKGGTIYPTNETLTLNEIMSILSQFSRLAKVPLTQMFKAKIGNLSINAFISPVSGTRFMIVKG